MNSAANPELHSYADADELARAAASAWLDEIAAAARAGQAHCVALSGGRIMQKLFATTAALARERAVPFDGVQFFWADERCVPPTDPESNYKLAEEGLLKPLKIAPKKIHRLRGEEIPQVAVQIADAELCELTPKNPKQLPMLDLIFLGMGEDGHVASLFPNAAANIVDKFVPFLAVKNSPKPPPNRLTLSYQAIFAARNIWVLISGSGKADALRAALSGKAATPLGRVIAARPVKIFYDINEF
jgi:6-phosphogluconolactonase